MRAAKKEGFHGLPGLLLSNREAGGKEKSESGAENIWGESSPLEASNRIGGLDGEGLVESDPSEKEPNDEDTEGDFDFVNKCDGCGEESLAAFSVGEFVEVANVGNNRIAENNADGNKGSGNSGCHQLKVRIRRRIKQRYEQGLEQRQSRADNKSCALPDLFRNLRDERHESEGQEGGHCEGPAHDLVGLGLVAGADEVEIDEKIELVEDHKSKSGEEPHGDINAEGLESHGLAERGGKAGMLPS